MKLSQVNPTPFYPVVIPSTKKKAKYRPFFVKEERALLAAQESEDLGVMLTTLKQIVENCIEPSSSVEGMTSFDLEYLFTLIRAKSVGEFSDLIFKCDTCDDPKARTKVSLDLRTVTVEGSSTTNKIKISDTITVLMRYPTMDELVDLQENEGKPNAKEIALSSCIESIYVEDEVYHVKEEPASEVLAFLDSLTSKQFKMLEEFVENAPTAQIKVQYACPVCGAQHNKVLRGLNNFF